MGFTTMVANEDLEKAKAYLNQVSWANGLIIIIIIILYTHH